MAETESWKLKISAKDEIVVPADVEKLLLDWHEGKRGNRAAVKDLKESSFVDVPWDRIKGRLTADIRTRNEARDAEEADRDDLAKIRKLRDWALEQYDRDLVAQAVAGLIKKSVVDVEKQLARLDEEDAAAE